jgi:membrane-bound serine protease (ClpP class)
VSDEACVARLPIVRARLALLAGLVLVGVGAGLLGPLGGPAAGAQEAQEDGEPSDEGYVQVIEVSGLLDPVLVQFVEEQIGAADRGGATALILQMNSTGAVVDDADVVALAEAIDDADTQVGVWIGPSGSSARGAAAELAGVAPLAGMAPGTQLGDVGDGVVPEALLRPDFAAAVDAIRDDTVGQEEALAFGLVDVDAPTVGDFVLGIDGFETTLVLGGVAVTDPDADVRWGATIQQEPITEVRFSKLPLTDRLFHTVASPAVAYLLFVIGMGLLLFELYTAGVGVAGVVGAGSFLLGCYGLGVLPTRGWAVALLVVAFLAFGVDVQTGVPRFWSVVGGICFTIGTFSLFDGLSISWVTLLFAFVGVALFVVTAMPSMVRTRFSTPTIGREDLIGEVGEALTEISPEGTVTVRGAPWRALVNRATPIPAGDPIRVASIEGMVLEVEPLEGAAQDYRERRTKRSWEPGPPS